MPYKTRKNEQYNDCWMYYLLLTTLVILIQSLKSYEFTILDVSIPFSFLLVPVTFLCTNFIVKRYDYKKAVAAICISAVMSIVFSAVIAFAVGKTFILANFTGEFCAYIASQFVNLTIYLFLLNNTRCPFFVLLFNYFFSILIYYLFYTLMYLDSVLLDSYLIRYFYTVIIDFIICIPLTFVDIKVKRGIE